MGLLSFFVKLFGIQRAPEKAELLCFGLGNPGPKYRNTRHNAGYRVIDGLSAGLPGAVGSFGAESGIWKESEYIGGTIAGNRVILVKPLTFMNRSGEAVGGWVSGMNVSTQKIIVVVDDFNLPLGSIRIRKDGSHGGHNGLKSIVEHIGSNFPRLRIGIGPLPRGVDIIQFVLSDFGADEEEKLKFSVKKAIEAILVFWEKGAETAMNKFNSN